MIKDIGWVLSVVITRLHIAQFAASASLTRCSLAATMTHQSPPPPFLHRGLGVIVAAIKRHSPELYIIKDWNTAEQHARPPFPPVAKLEFCHLLVWLSSTNIQHFYFSLVHCYHRQTHISMIFTVSFHYHPWILVDNEPLLRYKILRDKYMKRMLDSLNGALSINQSTLPCPLTRSAITEFQGKRDIQQRFNGSFDQFTRIQANCQIVHFASVIINIGGWSRISAMDFPILRDIADGKKQLESSRVQFHPNVNFNQSINLFDF